MTQAPPLDTTASAEEGGTRRIEPRRPRRSRGDRAFAAWLLKLTWAEGLLIGAMTPRQFGPSTRRPFSRVSASSCAAGEPGPLPIAAVQRTWMGVAHATGSGVRRIGTSAGQIEPEHRRDERLSPRAPRPATHRHLRDGNGAGAARPDRG